MARVGTHRGGNWDRGVVAAALGVPPLTVEPVRAPVLTIDGIIEDDATRWLRELDDRTGARRTKTPATRANSLRALLNFLTAQNTSLRGATNAHIRAYLNARTTGPNRVSGNTIASDRTQ